MKAPAPIPGFVAQCVHEGWLCRIGFWTEREWAALAPERRPAAAEYVPGRGWVAPVPEVALN